MNVRLYQIREKIKKSRHHHASIPNRDDVTLHPVLFHPMTLQFKNELKTETYKKCKIFEKFSRYILHSHSINKLHYLSELTKH